MRLTSRARRFGDASVRGVDVRRVVSRELESRRVEVEPSVRVDERREVEPVVREVERVEVAILFSVSAHCGAVSVEASYIILLALSSTFFILSPLPLLRHGHGYHLDCQRR
jgi:hypothetical protein